MKKITHINDELRDQIIRLAWEDTVSFEDIFNTYNLRYDQVRHIMSSYMKPKMFIRWQTRISKMGYKHLEKFKERIHLKQLNTET